MSQVRVYIHFLRDMLEHAQKARNFVEGMSGDEFLRDEKTVFAAIRALEIVGEAAKQVPDSVREQHPDIAWRDISRMRDKLIHHYFGVNLKLVWKTLQDDLPVLIPKLEKLIEAEADFPPSQES